MHIIHSSIQSMLIRIPIQIDTVKRNKNFAFIYILPRGRRRLSDLRPCRFLWRHLSAIHRRDIPLPPYTTPKRLYRNTMSFLKKQFPKSSWQEHYPISYSGMVSGYFLVRILHYYYITIIINWYQDNLLNNKYERISHFYIKYERHCLV